MSMRENDRKTTKKWHFPTLTPLSARILQAGLCLLYASALRLWWEILKVGGGFSQATAARFGAMLEYPVAGLALLTAFTYLVDRVMRDT